MGKERSMTSVITMMQVLLFSMAAAVITVMAFGIAVQNHLQVRFMDRLEVSDRILEDLYVMEQDFREFGHEWGEESYSVYKEQVKQILKELEIFNQKQDFCAYAIEMRGRHSFVVLFYHMGNDIFPMKQKKAKTLTNCCKHLCFNCLLFCTLIQYHVSLNLSTGNLKRFFVGFRP